MAYVYSTLTNGTVYRGYTKGGETDPVVTYSIEIAGGHGLMDSHFLVNEGVATEVTDKELETLLKDEHFKNHVKNGFLKYSKTKTDKSKAISDLEKRDKSAQIVPQDFKDKKNEPKVN